VVNRVLPDLTALPALSETRDSQVRPEDVEIPEPLETPVCQAGQDQQETLGHLDLPDLRDQRDFPDRKDPPGRLEQQEHLELRADLE